MSEEGEDKEVLCPKCGDVIAEVDFLIGLANVSGTCADGSIDFEGQTDIDWDGQKHAGTDPLFVCKGCQQVYDSLFPEPHRIPDGAADFTVMTDRDMTWQCPKCGCTTQHSYDDLVEVGNPVCGDCDEEMERLISLPKKEQYVAFNKAKKVKKPGKAPKKAKGGTPEPEKADVAEAIASSLMGDQE